MRREMPYSTFSSNTTSANSRLVCGRAALVFSILIERAGRARSVADAVVASSPVSGQATAGLGSGGGVGAGARVTAGAEALTVVFGSMMSAGAHAAKTISVIAAS